MAYRNPRWQSGSKMQLPLLFLKQRPFPTKITKLFKRKISVSEWRTKSYTKGGQRQKSYGHACPLGYIRENSIEDTVSFIKELQKEYPVSRLCKVLRSARSTYYEVSVGVPSKRQRENAEFAVAVRDCFYESKHRYGAVKLQRVLEENGYPCSVKRVQRYMAAQNLRSVTCWKYRPQSSKTEIPERDNVLNQEFVPDTICQKWCGDITYIHTQEDGWTYLASVMYLYSRKIIG